NFNATAAQNYVISPASLIGLSGNVTLAGADLITVASSINFTGSGVSSFTLNSNGDINLNSGVSITAANQPITLISAGDINFLTGGSGTPTGIVTTGAAGSVTLTATGNITLNAANNRGSVITTNGAAISLTAGSNVL